MVIVGKEKKKKISETCLYLFVVDYLLLSSLFCPTLIHR